MAKSPNKPAMSEPEVPAMPVEGGSYIRQADGTLTRVAFTAMPHEVQPEPAQTSPIETMSLGNPPATANEEPA